MVVAVFALMHLLIRLFDCWIMLWLLVRRLLIGDASINLSAVDAFFRRLLIQLLMMRILVRLLFCLCVDC